MSSENIFETDVLVIGGGMAGCFAAIKAREQGAEVTLVDKGYTSRSGQTPFAGAFCVFNEAKGDDLAAWMNHVNTVGEYVNNRDWTEIGFRDSYARYQDLVSWGAEVERDENSEVVVGSPPDRPCRALILGWRGFATALRKQAIKAGVKIMDRVMMTDLLKQDGRIVGAIGMQVGSYDILTFKAKATVICAGAGGFKPWGWPISALTSDGDVMAYRAGAEITGKEFPDPHHTSAEYPAHFGHIMRDGRPISGKVLNVEGNPLKRRGAMFIEMEIEAHAGRAPLTQITDKGEKITRVGGGSSGMSVHKTEGIWPNGTDGSAGLPGLYAAGDALGTMQVGAIYSCGGTGLMGAAVTGAIAGTSAADYSKKAAKPEIARTEITRLTQAIQMPLERKGGYSPGWVTQVLQNTMIPYFIMYIKHGDRMQAALTIVEFLRDHMTPMLFAHDPHELRLALETKNMILNAEMRLRASLFRTESRGCHYREDFPSRNDPDWLAWVLLKEENGEMKLSKKPVPKEWWPDLSKPYDERYAFRFPGE